MASDGCRLHYERIGAGLIEVLIPGLGGDGRFWAVVVAELADRFDLLAIAHRGAGRSDWPAGSYTIEGIAADMLAVMDAEEIDAAHLVGHSTGDAVVQTVALDAPGRARSLVISGSWDQPDARFHATFEVRAALLDADIRVNCCRFGKHTPTTTTNSTMYPSTEKRTWRDVAGIAPVA